MKPGDAEPVKVPDLSRAERSWEDRTAELRDLPEHLAGEAVGFDLHAVESGLGEDDRGRWIDTLVEQFGRAGMTTRLAAQIWPVCGAPVIEASQHGDAVAIFAESLRALLDAVTMAARPRMEAECHRIAFGIRRSDDDSMRGVAKRSGVTVEAVSKRVEAIRVQHGLAINSFNKSAEAAANYAKTNRRKRG